MKWQPIFAQHENDEAYKAHKETFLMEGLRRYCM
jgi:hypothetical protein